MAKTLDEDLNIVARSGAGSALLAALAFPDNLKIVQGLEDEPNDVGGMSADDLKKTFDKAGLTIQTYINETLVPEVVASQATETHRTENEIERQTAESARKSAENKRVTAEAKRQSAEKARQAAEEARQGAVGEQVSHAQNAARAAQAASDQAGGYMDAALQYESGANLARDQATQEAGLAAQSAADAQAAAQQIQNMTVEAQSVPAGSPAAVEKTTSASGVVNLKLSIPQGAQGPQGPQGPAGVAGVAGVAGKSAYQYAVEGGYTGTEAQFKELMADAASKEYVQNFVLLETATAMDKLVKIVVRCESTDVVKTVYVKLAIPPGNHANTPNCYCLNYSGTIHGSGTITIKLEPPTGYAFNAISGTFCPDVIVGGMGTSGVLDADGGYTFTISNATAGESYFFATNYAHGGEPKYNYALPTLEVA